MARALTVFLRALAIALLAAGLGIGTPAEASARGPSGSVKRLAVVVSANDGGMARVQLRYAGSDAESLIQVLEELGGLSAKSRLVLKEPSLAALKEAFATISGQVAAAKTRHRRVELIFYYSGHSDEHGLLMGAERYSYDALRKALAGVGADVHIAILDSCASGAMTRTKGGIRRPGFLSDASLRVTGHAYLTSASEDEAAQESDRIGGSYFTHYLVSGLRGAADGSGDGRVTLNEAYQYAFQETLARTVGTRHGAQHPGYEIQLVGSGDLVLTEVSGRRTAALRLERGISGQVMVRDGTGRLMMELDKPSDRVVRLAVPPGDYEIVTYKAGGLAQANVTVKRGASVAVHPRDLKAIAPIQTVARGGSPRAPAPKMVAQAPLNSGGPGEGAQTRVQVTVRSVTPMTPKADAVHLVGLSLFPKASTAGRADGETANIISINFGVGRSHQLFGMELGLLANTVRHEAYGLQIAAAGVNYVGSLYGLQIGTVGNIIHGSGESLGMQVGGTFNASHGNFTGLQAAPINVAYDRFSGLQLGVANYADDFTGLQAGGLNIADGVTGAQIGLLNIGGDVRGLQLGLINIADSVKGAPIGLINIVGGADAHQEFVVYSADSALLNIGAKLGNRHVYTLLTLGVQKPQDSDAALLVGAGLGGHIPFKSFFIDVEVVAQLVVSRFDEAALRLGLLSQLKVGLGYRITDSFAIFGGVSANILVYWGGVGTPENLSPLPFEMVEGIGETARVQPGFFLGIQL